MFALTSIFIICQKLGVSHTGQTIIYISKAKYSDITVTKNESHQENLKLGTNGFNYHCSQFKGFKKNRQVGMQQYNYWYCNIFFYNIVQYD